MSPRPKPPVIGAGALQCRLLPVAATALAAALPVALRPDRSAVAFGFVAVVLAALGAAIGSEPLPLLTIGFLLVSYFGATEDLEISARVGTAGIEALLVFVVHSAFGLSAAVPLRAAVDPSVWRRAGARTLPIALAGAALAGLTVVIADRAPHGALFAPFGILVAFGLAGLAYAPRRMGGALRRRG